MSQRRLRDPRFRDEATRITHAAMLMLSVYEWVFYPNVCMCADYWPSPAFQVVRALKRAKKRRADAKAAAATAAVATVDLR